MCTAGTRCTHTHRACTVLHGMRPQARVHACTLRYKHRCKQSSAGSGCCLWLPRASSCTRSEAAAPECTRTHITHAHTCRACTAAVYTHIAHTCTHCSHTHTPCRERLQPHPVLTHMHTHSPAVRSCSPAACTRTQVYKHVHTCTDADTLAHTSTYISLQRDCSLLCTHTHTSMHTHVSTHTHMQTCTRLHTQCTHLLTHAHLCRQGLQLHCAHTHTHTHCTYMHWAHTHIPAG